MAVRSSLALLVRSNYALKLSSAAAAAPQAASVLRTSWRAARLVLCHLDSSGRQRSQLNAVR